jgi:hypothetical protein
LLNNTATLLYSPTQQSADPLQLPDGKSFTQLSVPQLRFPAHSESLSQSPPPTLHGLVEEQQLHSVEGIPLHELGGGCVVACVVVLVVVDGAKIWTYIFIIRVAYIAQKMIFLE